MLAPNKDYVDLSKPSIAGLAYALRHREIWPKGFKWDFPQPDGCAIGLGGRLWGFHGSQWLSLACGISEEDRQVIFFAGNGRKRSVLDKVFGRYSEPTPEDIAARLEALITVEEKV